MNVQLIRIDLSATHVRVSNAAKPAGDAIVLGGKLTRRPQYTLNVTTSEKRKPTQHAGEVRKAATPANVHPIVTIQEPPPFAAPKLGGAKTAVDVQQPRIEGDEGGGGRQDAQKGTNADIETFPSRDGHQVIITGVSWRECARQLIKSSVTRYYRYEAEAPRAHTASTYRVFHGFLTRRDCFRGVLLGPRALRRYLAAEVVIYTEDSGEQGGWCLRRRDIYSMFRAAYTKH